MVRFPMLLVGLTGGLGSGKTTIARMFEQLGAHIIDADALAREVVKSGKPALKMIAKEFGNSILTPQQTLRREALAKIVFQTPGKLKRLTDILHPYIARAQARRTREIRLRDPNAVIVYDAAMLIEAQAHIRMDRVMVVRTDRDTQISRASQRDGLTRAETIRRLRHQMPLRDKLRYADIVIDGTASLKQLRAVVRVLYEDFRKQACQSKRATHRTHGLKGKDLPKKITYSRSLSS
ncbi:MAG: dephospho-CoA kinase [Nitrospirales bacterium]|nr:dephospho-CoA kinase [Nitrospirales bacterium]